MPNLTITTDEETLHWARVEAAQQNISVSKLVGKLLAEIRKQGDPYDRAMQDFFSRQPYLDPPPREDSRRWPTRDEIYDRPSPTSGT